MTEVQLTLNLPDSLAQAAMSAGLLLPDAIEKMLDEALRQRAIDSFFVAADKLSTANFPPITLQDIQNEVAAYRIEKKSGNS